MTDWEIDPTTTQPFPDSTTRHGTPSGFKKHQDLGEGPCAACYAAKATYDKRRLAAPDKKRRNRLSAAAQMQAYRSLAHKYPDEYRETYRAIKAELFAADGLSYRPIGDSDG